MRRFEEACRARELVAIAVVVAGTLAAQCASAVTLRVPSEYATINDAIDAAAFGDTVVVAPGTYHGEIRTYQYPYGSQETASVAFLRDGLTLLSEGGPDVTSMDLAGLSAAQSAVIVGALMPSSDNVIEGFTIVDSEGTVSRGVLTGQVGGLTVRDCVFIEIAIPSVGGAIYVGETALECEGCEFVVCTADQGGAIYALESSVSMRDCRIEGCGSIAVRVRSEEYLKALEVVDCVFLNNYANGGLGGISVSRLATARIEGCWFEGNVAMDGNSGAVSITETACEVVGNVFMANHAGGGGRGGALTLGSLTGTVIANTFWENSQANVAFGGGTIHSSASFVTLDRNIIARSAGSAVRRSFGGLMTSSCNVYWDNPQGHTDGFSMGPTDRVVDPLFCDPENDDLHLMENSPCLPLFSEGCGLIGALGEACGTISIDERSWGEIKAKYFRPSGGAGHD